MYILSILLLFITLSFSVSAEEYSSTISQYFSDIIFIDNAQKVQLNFRQNGPKYNYIHYKDNENIYGRVGYGEKLILNEGESIRLATKGSNLLLSSFNNAEGNEKDDSPERVLGKGWNIKTIKDMRSFGHGVEEIDFHILVNPSLNLRKEVQAKYKSKKEFTLIEKNGLLIVENIKQNFNRLDKLFERNKINDKDVSNDIENEINHNHSYKQKKSDEADTSNIEKGHDKNDRLILILLIVLLIAVMIYRGWSQKDK